MSLILLPLDEKVRLSSKRLSSCRMCDKDDSPLYMVVDSFEILFDWAERRYVAGELSIFVYDVVCSESCFVLYLLKSDLGNTTYRRRSRTFNKSIKCACGEIHCPYPAYNKYGYSI